MMDGSLLSFALLMVTVATLTAIRGRRLSLQIGAEIVLVLAIGSYLVWNGTPPLPRKTGFPDGLSGAWLRALAVIWWLVVARLTVNATLILRGRDPRSRDARLFSDLVAAVIYITAVLIILNSVLDLPISGLIATSGVIAIVLGLALQNTLADVFSGIAVGLEKPFHVGDRVSIGTDLEGVIVELNWRSMRIRTDGDDLATIPNSIVAKGQLINRSVPTTRRAASIEIVTPADVHAEIVFDLMRQATLLCPDVVATPAPVFMLDRTGLRTATYSVKFYVPDTPLLAATKSNLLRQVRRMFRHAGIGHEAPMPDADLLGSLVMFEALSPEERAVLAAGMIAHPVEAGDVVFEQGSTGTAIYIIKAGVFESVQQAAHGPARTLGRIGPGGYLGELCLITGDPRRVTLTALTRGTVMELPGSGLRALIAKNAALGSAVERSVRRSLELLDRDEGAIAAQREEHVPDLLARIRTFFRV